MSSLLLATLKEYEKKTEESIGYVNNLKGLFYVSCDTEIAKDFFERAGITNDEVETLRSATFVEQALADQIPILSKFFNRLVLNVKMMNRIWGR